MGQIMLMGPMKGLVMGYKPLVMAGHVPQRPPLATGLSL